MSGTAVRNIVLTGATRGLGRALVDRFAEAGHAVWACGRSTEGTRELAAIDGVEAEAVDVTDDAAVGAWAERVLAACGAPDLVVNNAGLINRPAPLWEVSAEEFDAVVAVNLSGIANVVRAFVPAMVERRSGIVANLSSGWGRSTSPEVAPYCATKWGVEGLTDALASELPSGMGAYAVNPGVIDTDMLRVAWGDGASAYDGPDAWSRRAAPFLLGLGPGPRNSSVTVP